MAAADAVPVVVNGTEHHLRCEERGGSLLVALRAQLGLCGVRTACGVGECGACTVLVDGRPTRSCITNVEEVASCTVTTPEGLGSPEDPHPIQQAFLAAQAAQCGYCVNGMIMTVAALAGQAQRPARADLVEALAEHLCRCGTHLRILQAAEQALGVSSASPDDDAAAGPPLQSGTSQCTIVRRALDCDEPQTALPALLEDSPRVEQWLSLRGDGRVELRSGRAELGQGVHIALAQIVAAQLGISVDQVVVRQPTTASGPDEGYTSGSRSMQEGGVAVAMAATAFRRLLLERAAAYLGTDAHELRVESADVVWTRSEASVPFAHLVGDTPLAGTILPSDQPRWSGRPFGDSPPRDDLAGKLTGAPGYVHDLQLPGMLYARAVLPPTYDAQLELLDTSGVEALAGVAAVVREGRLLIVIADSDAGACAAVASLTARARWHVPPLGLSSDQAATLRKLATEPHQVRADPDIERALDRGHRVHSSYSRPYQAHGAVAPSCAVARADDDRWAGSGPETMRIQPTLTVWTHSQGVHPLRRELAALLDLDIPQITVHGGYGPGCYGHNGADDAAAFAAVAARAVPGHPVRFQFSLADEFGWEPYGSAMAADLEASLDDRGAIVAWRLRTLTDTHMGRPRGQGDRLAVAWLRASGVNRPQLGASAGGARNLLPLYDIPSVEAIADHVRGPLRTGPLRSLGAFFNVFAIESFMDELAEAAGQDPLAFRLAHLHDQRAREVLERAAETVGWRPRVGPSGRGQGLALARYSDTRAYLAMVAEMHVDLADSRIGVDRLVMVADAGVVVHTDGLRQQLEGGALQGLSRTLHERLVAGEGGVGSREWSTYPVLGFRELPAVATILIDRPDSPPLGAGEVATTVVPAAVANAIDDAVGIRLRDLPFTTQTVGDRLLAMSPQEEARLILD